MEFYISSTTVNNNKNVFIPFNSISHVIENPLDTHANKPLDEFTNSTTWIHFHSGKSIHINIPYTDAIEEFESYVNYSRS
jgi:hypothetical protein